MRKDIIGLERRLRAIYDKDRSSPELYVAIKDLSAALLVVKRMAMYRNEIDEISHILAADMYLQIQDGLQIYSWTKYIWLRLLRTRDNYINETRGVEFTNEDAMIIGVGTYPSRSYRMMNDIELLDVIRSLSTIFMEKFDKYIRYKDTTEEYKLIKRSVMLTITNRLNDNWTVILASGLDSSYESYVGFLVELLLRRVSLSLRKLLGQELAEIDRYKELFSKKLSWEVLRDD